MSIVQHIAGHISMENSPGNIIILSEIFSLKKKKYIYNKIYDPQKESDPTSPRPDIKCNTAISRDKYINRIQ